MATTGYFEQQAGGNSYQQKWALRLEYSYDTNAAGTVTTITWTLKVYDGTGESWNGDGSAYYWITAWSGNQYLSYHYTGVGWYTLGSFTDTYSRTPGEARTITADAAWYSGLSSSYTPGSISLSESLTFPAVAGATTPTIGAVTLGSPVDIVINAASSAFRHIVTCTFCGITDTIANMAAGGTCTWSPPLSLASQIPNAATGTGTITCTTYNGDTVIGTKTIGFTASVPASVVPTVSALMYPSNTNTWVADKGIYAAGFSRVCIDTTGAGVYGSTVSRIDITGDVLNYNAPASATSDVLTAGTKTVTVTVTDSRGRSASTTKSITVQPYAPPVINNLSYKRGSYTGGVWADNDQGEDVKITLDLGLSLTDYGNAASITVAVDGETTQTTTGAGAGGKVYYFKTIGTDVSRNMTVTATDSTGTTGSKSGTVPTISVAANYNPATGAMCFGGVAERANAVEFKRPVYVNGVSLLDYCHPVKSYYMSDDPTSPAVLFGGTWVQIKDRFLLAAGDAYAAGTTGGEASHTLSTEEMPSHFHNAYSGYTGGGTYFPAYSAKTGYTESEIPDGYTAATTRAGGGQPHNNMPPYLAVYMWKRTA